MLSVSDLQVNLVTRLSKLMRKEFGLIVPRHRRSVLCWMLDRASIGSRQRCRLRARAGAQRGCKTK